MKNKLKNYSKNSSENLGDNSSKIKNNQSKFKWTNPSMKSQKEKKEHSEIQFQKRAFFKLILLGDLGVGKTTLASKYVKDFLKESQLCNLKMDFATKEVKIRNTMIELQIWDTCGQEEYKTLTKQFFRDCNGCIIVYDVTNRTSFDNVLKWKNDILENCNENFPICLVGNKIECSSERKVSTEEGKKLADENKFEFIETSALQIRNVKEAFKLIAEQMLNFYEAQAEGKGEGAKKEKRKSSNLDINIKTLKFKKRNNSFC